MTTVDTAIATQKTDNVLVAPDIITTTTELHTLEAVADTTTLSIGLYNATTSSDVYAYITGLAINSNYAVYLLQSDGATAYYPISPSTNGSALTANCAIALGAPGTTRTVTIPQIAGGRIWFSVGAKLTFLLNTGTSGPGLVEPSVGNTSDPNYNLTWDFCEFTYNSDQLYANITYVDFVCLPIALTVTDTSGTVQHVGGLPSNGLAQVCNGLIAQNAIDGAGWDQLIVQHSGTNLRVLSPTNGIQMNPSLFENYWDDYITEVFAKYVSTPLQVDTQAQWGIVEGLTSNDRSSITFSGIGSFGKPAAADIFGASSGVFAAQATNTDELLNIGARLDAAYNRSTLLIDTQQPDGEVVADYYQNSITNHYARVVHAANVDGRGYCFPYDDVTPGTTIDQSGFVSDGSPSSFLVTVGGGNAYAKRDFKAGSPVQQPATKSIARRSVHWKEDVKALPQYIDLERGEHPKLLNEFSRPVPETGFKVPPVMDRLFGKYLTKFRGSPLYIQRLRPIIEVINTFFISFLSLSLRAILSRVCLIVFMLLFYFFGMLLHGSGTEETRKRMMESVAMMNGTLFAQLSRKMSTDSKPQQYEQFFRYDSGRWLWNEENELRERYRMFNVEELKRIAAESIGAKSCVSMIKLGEGGYNKVFKLVMDNGSVAIARIPCPNAGPAFMTTASEVATMEFARTILNIPVPRIYAWSSVTQNPVQAEYIVMEEAPGILLADRWKDLGLQSKDKIIQDLVTIEKKLLSVTFTRHGNIYFTKDSFPGCEKAEVSSDLPLELKKEVAKRFTIGPVVEHVFWKKERASMPIERGPWKSAPDYLKALANNQIRWLSQQPVRELSTNMFPKSDAQNSPDAHIALYKKYLSISPYIFPRDERMTRSTLWHWDMHAPNLFVKDDRITSLIDWQSVWAGPLFLQYGYPKLVNYTGDVMLRLPENYKEMEKNEKERVTNQVERSLVQYLYETETKKQNPLLVEVNNIPHGMTRRQAIEFAQDTWDGDILPFRQCLIRLERHWDEMGFDIPCPIHFTEEDLQNHMRDGEGWNEQADFWDNLEGFVSRDGWTSNETYIEALEMFVGLREEGLKQMIGEEKERFEKQTRWPLLFHFLGGKCLGGSMWCDAIAGYKSMLEDRKIHHRDSSEVNIIMSDSATEGARKGKPIDLESAKECSLAPTRTYSRVKRPGVIPKNGSLD
ncbi:hypothetical protein B7494_g3235 [Chlorociboria aeruginascens]|nr:hypothetical protein B7494_g3235 [Chlorociboria aeruginascens]